MADTSREKRGHPWREQIEAMVVAVVVAVLLKLFVLEAYKIPSGSMQPTLIGIDEGEHLIEDRILVDKVSYLLRDPRRFEVAVFRYPLDRSKSFVKRVVGLPGEWIKIEHGDVWTRTTEGEPWRIARRPPGVQAAHWKRLDREEPAETSWSTRAAGWTVEARTIEAGGSGRAAFRSDLGSVMNVYDHGYPEAVLDLGAVPRVHQDSGQIPVGDLRVTGEVVARAGCTAVQVELAEGGREYRFRIPGPAAPSSEAPTIQVVEAGFRPQRTVGAETRYHLPAGEPVRFAAENLDDRLALEIDGMVVCSTPVELAVDQTSGAAVAVEGEGALLRDLMVHRDLYYTSHRSRVWQQYVPEGHYFVLGDNTQSSSDSREWTLVTYRHTDPETGETRELRAGFERRNGNPYVDAGHPDGPVLWIRDEWGERHRLLQEETQRVRSEPAPLVPREMVLGRAIAVFWPLSPSRDLYRLGWVR